MMVVDNSVVMRWLFRDGSDVDRAYAAHVAGLVESSQVYVPALFVAEASNVISRALKAGLVSRVDCTEFFDIIDAMQAEVVGIDSTLEARPVALEAFEQGLSAYDTTYLRLARSLGCPLATLDKDLRKAAERSGVQLVVAAQPS